MPFPNWLAYGVAVVMLTISVYCVFRLAFAGRMGRRNHHDVNVAHVLMGLAMAGMLVPRWRVVPVGAWEVVFAGVGTYFLILSVRFVAQRGVAGADDDRVHHLSHYAIHMVMAGAMLYMFWLSTSTGVGLGASMSISVLQRGVGDPGLTLALVVVLVISAIWQLDALGRFAPQGQRVLAAAGTGGPVARAGVAAAPSRPWLAPRLEICCHVAMCVAMGYMLVLMV